MKLHAIRRNDHSTQGLWWDYERGERVSEPNERLCVRIAERDNPQHRASLARLQLDYAEKLRAGGDIAVAAWNKIQTRAMAEAILMDWVNVDDDDGEPMAYTADAGEKALADKSLWPFRNFVEDTAGIVRGYRIEQEAEAKGN